MHDPLDVYVSFYVPTFHCVRVSFLQLVFLKDSLCDCIYICAMVLSVCLHFFACITFLLLVCVSEYLCVLALCVPAFHCMRVGFLRVAIFMIVSMCQ